jgi:hypothetical protein
MIFQAGFEVFEVLGSQHEYVQKCPAHRSCTDELWEFEARRQILVTERSCEERCAEDMQSFEML